MSAILDSLLDDERRLACASNDAATQPRELRAFRILIGQRGSPRLDFACMAPDSTTAVMQHIDLAEVSERVEAVPVRAAMQEPKP